MSTFTSARDPRVDPRDGDEIRFRGFRVAVLLRTEDAMTIRIFTDGSESPQTLTWRPLCLSFWREFASAGEVTRRGDE